MIVPGHRVRILIAAKPVDFRKGLDGLTALVKSELQRDPYTGTVFVFRSRRADRLKLLYWDGSGLVLTYKRLEAQRFVSKLQSGTLALNPAQFEALFAGLDWQKVRSVSVRPPPAGDGVIFWG